MGLRHIKQFVKTKINMLQFYNKQLIDMLGGTINVDLSLCPWLCYGMLDLWKIT